MVAVTKLKYLHALSPELDTTKLFVVGVLLSCVMRCLSVIAIGVLSLQSIRVWSSNSDTDNTPSNSTPQDPDQDFYAKVSEDYHEKWHAE